MTETAKQEIFEVLALQDGNASYRALFQKHIAERQGVIVWRSVDLSFPRGDTFMPKLGPNGEDNTATPPHWAYRLLEVVTDIQRFKFAKAHKELARCKIALGQPHGMRMRVDLTTASTRRVERLHAKLKEQHPGKIITYRFDPSGPMGFFDPGQKYAIFEMAEWDEG